MCRRGKFGVFFVDGARVFVLPVTAPALAYPGNRMSQKYLRVAATRRMIAKIERAAGASARQIVNCERSKVSNGSA
jgi:hypothetical protein